MITCNVKNCSIVIGCILFMLDEGAFTLGVKDSSIKSPNTKLVIYNLNLLNTKTLC